ncbi:inactive Rho GTPase-activating protein 11B-like isoform X2 [Hippocampus zosterae]|nr:inactive Rho GTPase-activating protein 11B-like isoform X2 [Hippocampus zosterae]
MTVAERKAIRKVARQHLRTAYGIKVKKWKEKKQVRYESTATKSTKVFGVPLECLPCSQVEYGSVPCFLVDACMNLLEHVDTEGLFRVSGSLAHLKTLQKKLDSGEECLSACRPCDVAGLVKKFFKELPEPVLPTKMQEAFLKAQHLPTKEDRTCATMLLSCVLPDASQSVMRHISEFLLKVSKRSAKNKMDCANLSLVLAPTLLQSETVKKMDGKTESRLQLERDVLHCFIENAHHIGKMPQMLQEKLSAKMDCESAFASFLDKIKRSVTTVKAKRWHCKTYKLETQTFSHQPKALSLCTCWTVSSQLPDTATDTGITLVKHRMRDENLTVTMMSQRRS